MARLNVPIKSDLVTHEGAPAKRINAEQELRRSLMACLLWEDSFYEDGVSIADRIASLVKYVDPLKVAEMAVEARGKMKLRHAPLWVIREMARLDPHRKLVAVALARVIQRADELAEFLAMYWKDGRQPLSAQVKKGLAQAFQKFDEYQLAKYNRDDGVKLRDVLFLSHAKPKDDEQAALWKRLIDGKLAIPNTWENRLSAGEDKKAVWESMLREGELGALALLRNLRNMHDVGVDADLIFKSLASMKTDRVLPYRFIAAARYAPQWESHIEQAMLKSIEGAEKLPGKTVLLVDVSSSMNAPVSGKSDLNRIDAACGLAILARELCEDVAVYTFSNNVVRIPDRHGFALRDAINSSQPHKNTYLGKAVQEINISDEYDRLIVLTDEQSQDRIENPTGGGYVVNVAAYQNGVGYGAWVHIDGWSESVLQYIQEFEKAE